MADRKRRRARRAANLPPARRLRAGGPLALSLILYPLLFALPASAHGIPRLPEENPHRARLRRRTRDGTRTGPQPVDTAAQPHLPEARGQPAGVLVQAARRVQQDGAHSGRRAHARRDHRVRRQPCAGRRVLGGAHGREGGDRRAGHDAAGEGRRSARARRPERRGDPGRRVVQRCVRACAQGAAGARPHVRASVRRSVRDRRPGHDRDGSPAAASGADPRDLRADRRRRARVGRRRVREGRAARDQGDRRAGGGFVRDGAVAAEGRTRRAQRSRAVRRRHRGEAGRRGDLPAVQRIPRRRRHRRHRRAVRGDQGRVPGHAQRARAVRRAGGRRRQALRGTRRDRESDARRGHLRREHELRPDALRGRTRGSGRGARSRVRGHDPRGARQLQAVLLAGGRPQRDRVQLPDRR